MVLSSLLIKKKPIRRVDTMSLFETVGIIYYNTARPFRRKETPSHCPSSRALSAKTLLSVTALLGR